MFAVKFDALIVESFRPLKKLIAILIWDHMAIPGVEPVSLFKIAWIFEIDVIFRCYKSWEVWITEYIVIKAPGKALFYSRTILNQKKQIPGRP